MKKKLLCILLVLLSVCVLAACSAFEKEYVSVHEYEPSVQEQSVSDGKINVRNYSALKNALLGMAYRGQTEGSIVFDAAYDGDTTEDMASACWTVRTQDALCAYCVENIAYELNKIVTINEANVYISYSDVCESPENIEHLAFSSEAESAILDAMRNGVRRLTLLVGRSSFSADDMAAQVMKAYRENPIVVPKEPNASVNIFSGTGSQRLYEIHIGYGLNQEELSERREQLEELSPFSEIEWEDLNQAERAFLACSYLMDNCALSEEPGENSAYSALVDHRADSEGIAFAYVALCSRLGLDCRIVYGQHDWQERCWNIVRVDNSYYHVDVVQCMETGPASAFLLNDESFWGIYRWDVASYPKCTGTLQFLDLFPEVETEVTEDQNKMSESESGLPEELEAVP